MIRRVRADEWQSLRDLRLAALADSPQSFITTLAQARQRSDEEWRRAAVDGAEGGRWATFIADEGGRLVGMASGHFPDEQHRRHDDPMFVGLIQMWVAPEWRRRGVGSALVSAVRSWAAQNSSPVVRLEVTSSDRGAVAFYEAAGFRDTGRRDERSPVPGVPAMEMEATAG